MIRREQDVDALEVQMDEAVVSLIARLYPVAKDLRIITSFSKAVTDLERVGDEAARIAYLAINMYGSENSDPCTYLLRDITTMGKLSLGMLKDGLAIFDTFDIDRAIELSKSHFELDAEFQSSLRYLATFVLEDARNVGHTINITLAIKALERVSDHARNLAEYIIYLIKGDDVRHKGAD